MSHVHHSGEVVPPHYSGGGEGSLVGAGARPWSLQEEIVAQYRSRIALRSPPGSPQVCKVRDILYLRLMEHCQRRNFSAMIQCVPQHRLVLLPLLLLLLLLLLLSLPLPPQLLVRVRLSGTTNEAFGPPLHFVK